MPLLPLLPFPQLLPILLNGFGMGIIAPLLVIPAAVCTIRIAHEIKSVKSRREVGYFVNIN
jgi:hypothetical protein